MLRTDRHGMTQNRPLGTVSTLAAIGLAILLGLPITSGLAAGKTAAPQSLPGGASSLQETYQDWQVSCREEKDGRHCALLQQQRRKGTKQLVLAAEFGAEEKDGSVKGSLILPFGLLLQPGITLKMDDKPTTSSFAFRTCLPVGCIVPLTLDKAMVASLRSGTTLKIAVTVSDGSQPLHLSVPLKGFAQALDRVKELSGGR